MIYPFTGYYFLNFHCGPVVRPESVKSGRTGRRYIWSAPKVAYVYIYRVRPIWESCEVAIQPCWHVFCFRLSTLPHTIFFLSLLRSYSLPQHGHFSIWKMVTVKSKKMYRRKKRTLFIWMHRASYTWLMLSHFENGHLDEISSFSRLGV